MYQTMYTHLFNAVTDAIELLSDGEILHSKKILVRAQQETEEMYLNSLEEAP